MPTFGNYTTVGEPLAVTEEADYVSTIWRAQKPGPANDRLYAIKCYAPRRRRPKPGQAEDALEGDRAVEFLEGVKQLKKAATENRRCLSPIHDFGISEEHAWYVTDFCQRKTLKEWAAQRGRVDSAGLRHVIHSVATGCLALRQSRGYSHGNLKASNVLLAGKPRPLRSTPLHLIDPYPAAPLQLAQLEGEDRREVHDLLRQTVEAQDLRVIGELILQLVEGRLVTSGYDYNYPIARSPAWDKLGKNNERWRELCNRLLDPQLSLERVNLDTLEKEFRPSAVAAKLPRIASTVGAACLIGGAAFLVVLLRGTGREKKFQAHFQAATHAVNAATGAMPSSLTNLLIARQELELALKYKQQDPAAIEFRTSVEQQVKTNYDLLYIAAKDAFKTNDDEAATLVRIALILNPDGTMGRQLRDQISQAKIQKVERKKCDEAQANARRAEKEQRWSDAVRFWVTARNSCPGEPGITNEIAFVSGLTNVIALLNQARGLTNNAPSTATNRCEAALTALGKVERWAESAERKSALVKLKSEVAQVQGVAQVLIAGQTQQQKCVEAQANARKAEQDGHWGEAAWLWAVARNSCPGEPGITNEIAFVSGLTNVIALLNQARGLTNNAPSTATNRCEAALTALGKVERWAESAERKSALVKLKSEVAQVQGVAQVLIAGQMQQQKCVEAQANARKAEQDGNWGEAAWLWAVARNSCPGEPGITNEIAFVSGLTNVIALLNQARGLTNNAPSTATNRCEAALTALGKVEQWAESVERMGAITKLKKDVAQVQGVALSLIAERQRRQDLQSAQRSFDAGEYEIAIKLCDAHGSDQSFIDLAKVARGEKATFDRAWRDFTNGIYSFASQLRDKACARKGPFESLLARAEDEQGILNELYGMTNANNWPGVLTKLQTLDPAITSKPPFQQLREFADANDPVKKLDNDLEILRIVSGVKKTNERQLRDSVANRVAKQLGPGESVYVREHQKKLEAIVKELKRHPGAWEARKDDINKIEGKLGNMLK